MLWSEAREAGYRLARLPRRAPLPPSGPTRTTANAPGVLMSTDKSSKARTNVGRKRPPFERIALLLQGGGALGAYQGGVYQALAEADLHPDWVAGISIGAVNSALIAGNPPEKRVERLREFWESVTQSRLGIPHFKSNEKTDESAHRLVNQTRALGVLLFGAPNFFSPRLPPPYLYPPGSPEGLSFYEIAELRSTLERLVDFDRINSGGTQLSVGAVNVRTGNMIYFDSATQKIAPEHVMASGSLPPGFPATEIDGEHYWDGGLVSNTPLQWVMESEPRKDTLAFQIDLWNARGDFPRDLMQSDLRQKEIRFSSRTRMGTDHFRKQQELRRAFSRLMKHLPKALLQTPEGELLSSYADEKVYNIIQLIYHSQNYEGVSKDYEFSRWTMEEHWKAGYSDAVRTLRHPEVLERPKSADGVFTFDLARDGRE
jgi:NTE family protein